MKIVNLKVSDICVSGFNPPQRTTQRALASLTDDVKRNGVLSPVHVMAGATPHPLVDGHRRWSIAVQLKLETIPAVVHDVDRKEVARLWGSLNKNSRTVNALEWMQWWYDTGGVAEKEMPERILGNIRLCVRMLGGGNGGREGIKYLLDNRTGPGVAHVARQVRARLDDCPGLTKIPEGQIVRWLVGQHTQAIVQSVFSSGKLPNNLVRKMHVRIVKDAPLTLVDLVPKRRGE